MTTKDRDGKTTTASAVDASHYPDPSHHEDESTDLAPPSHHEIATLAYRLWLENGCAPGSSEKDWFEAEQQLQDAKMSNSLLQDVTAKGGSVQP